MNKSVNLFLGILLLINFACQNKTKKTSTSPQQKDNKNLVVIKPDKKIFSIDQLRDATGKNKNFEKLINSFQAETYTLDELTELTTQDIQYLQHLHRKAFNGNADTAAVHSRLILAEVNLKKLNFLLQKKKIQIDTIKSTLNAIIDNLNSVINQIELYNRSDDEFEHILKYDSLAKSNKDSSGGIKRRLKNGTKIVPGRKLPKLKLPQKIPINKPR